jgi:O-antigen/teichoic acid export membrane protein
LPRTLTHQVGILMLGRVLAYAVMFMTPMVNVRALSVEEYGYYRQFWLLFATFSPILLLGFPHSLMYYLPRAESEQEKSVYVTQTLVFGVALSLLSLVIYAVMAETLGAGMGAVTRAFYWRLSAFTVLMTGSAYMDWLFVADGQVGRQSIYHVIVTALQAIVVMSAAWFSREVNTVIWALTAFAFAKFLFAVGYTWKTYHPRPQMLSLHTIREQLSFAIPLGLFAIILVLVTQTDKFIISRFLGREGFAIYTVGAFELPFINVVSQSVRNVTFPVMAKHQKAGEYQAIAQLWRRAMLKMAVLFFPAFVFFEVVARPLITLLFTDEYAAATPIFMIYLVLLVRSAIDSAAVIQVFKKNGYLIRIFSFAFVVNLVLSLILFRSMGREGVPLATVITLLATNVINLYYASHLTGVPFFYLLPLGSLATRMLVAVLPGVGLWYLVPQFDTGNIFHLGMLGILYLAAYLGLSMRFGLLSLDDIRSLMGRSNGMGAQSGQDRKGG